MPTTPTLYCAPCTSDLALVREAVTFVSGTASCAAHAVLLTHPHDNPGRRRARLSQLRQLAESKAANASPEEQAALELLVHEYTLAGAMDMGGQPRPDGSPRRERGQAQPGDRPQGGQPGQPGQPGEPGEGRSKRGRRGRDRDRPRGDREVGAVPAGGSPEAPADSAPSEASSPAEAPVPSAPADSALPAGTSADGAPAPTSDGTPAGAPAPSGPPSMPEIVPAAPPAGTSDDGAPAPTADGSPA